MGEEAPKEFLHLDRPSHDVHMYATKTLYFQELCLSSCSLPPGLLSCQNITDGCQLSDSSTLPLHS